MFNEKSRGDKSSFSESESGTKKTGSRREFLKALGGGALAAASLELQSCSLSPKEIESLPTTELPHLIKNLAAYKDQPFLTKTQGYLQFMETDTVEDSSYRVTKDWQLKEDKTRTKRDYYRLNTDAALKGESLLAVTEQVGFELDGRPELKILRDPTTKIKGAEMPLATLIGKVKLIKRKDGKEVLTFQIMQIVGDPNSLSRE